MTAPRSPAVPLAAGLILALAACPGGGTGPAGSPSAALADSAAPPARTGDVTPTRPPATPTPVPATPTPVPATGPPGVVWVTTLAGGGVPGLADGIGPQARFDRPSCLVAGPAGTLYVVDQAHHGIRRIGRDGRIETVTARFAAGEAPSAVIPAGGLAVDASGSILFLDTRIPNTLRRIGPDGVVAQVAQIRVKTGDFFPGNRLAVDASGSAYLAGASQIVRITPDGTMSVVAGSERLGYRDGDGTAAEFNYPFGIVADRSGNLYVCDTYNHSIRKITATGRVTRVAGSLPGYWDGPAAAARLETPQGIALAPDGGLVWTEAGNTAVRRLDPAGNVSTLAGARWRKGLVDGAGPQARFRYPAGIAVDEAGRVIVADYLNSAIRAISVPW